MSDRMSRDDFYRRLYEFRGRQFAEHAAAIMQPIEQAEATVEIVELESWLDDELKCEFRHNGSGVCALDVTHRLVWCTGSGALCATAAEWNRREISEDTGECTECGGPVGECWRVVPS